MQTTSPIPSAAVELLAGVAPQKPPAARPQTPTGEAGRLRERRPSKEPTREHADFLREVAARVAGGAPRAEELDEVRDMILEAIATTPTGLANLNRISLLLGDLLRHRDDESAELLRQQLIDASLRIEQTHLPADQMMCWDSIASSLALTREEIARFAGVKPASVARWEKGVRSRNAVRALAPLAHCGYWLRRAGMNLDAARAWLFEIPHPALGKPPAEHFAAKAAWELPQLARLGYMVMREHEGLPVAETYRS